MWLQLWRQLSNCSYLVARSYLVEKSGNGLISYQVEHNYDHPTLRKLTSSKTLASSFLQRDHSKLQVFPYVLQQNHCVYRLCAGIAFKEYRSEAAQWHVANPAREHIAPAW